MFARRRGKEARERILASILLVPAAPLLALGALAIKVEGIFSREARGPVIFREERIARGRVVMILKFRTLKASTIASLEEGPTHIGKVERRDLMTRAGWWLKQWYLDELPQLLNVVSGDIGLIGTRPYPVELYEKELAEGITRKRDMPSGLIGPVQASKGTQGADQIALDAAYWEAFQTYPGWRLLLLDLKIVYGSLRVQLSHKGL